jgi:hypothetical protein
MERELTVTEMEQIARYTGKLLQGDFADDFAKLHRGQRRIWVQIARLKRSSSMWGAVSGAMTACLLAAAARFQK